MSYENNVNAVCYLISFFFKIYFISSKLEQQQEVLLPFQNIFYFTETGQQQEVLLTFQNIFYFTETVQQQEVLLTFQNIFYFTEIGTTTRSTTNMALFL